MGFSKFPSLRVPSPSLFKFFSPVAACLATPLPYPLFLLLRFLQKAGLVRPTTDVGPEGHGLMNMIQSILRLRPRELGPDSSLILSTGLAISLIISI